MKLIIKYHITKHYVTTWYKVAVYLNDYYSLRYIMDAVMSIIGLLQTVMKFTVRWYVFQITTIFGCSIMTSGIQQQRYPLTTIEFININPGAVACGS